MSTNTKYILLALATCLALIVAIPASVMAVVNQNRVAMGVYYGEERLSGMSREQVQDFFRQLPLRLKRFFDDPVRCDQRRSFHRTDRATAVTLLTLDQIAFRIIC